MSWVCAGPSGSPTSTTSSPPGICDLRVEQILGAQPGRTYPRCIGGRRAGPPEDWGGPFDYLERTQPYLVFDALTRAAEIVRHMLDAADEDDPAGVGVDREELADLLPLLGLGHFDRRAGNRALRGLAPSMDTDAAMQGSRG